MSKISDKILISRKQGQGHESDLWVSVLALSACCVTSSKSYTLGAQFIHQKKGDKNICFRVVFRINELIYIKHHIQCLTCRNVQNNKLFLLLWPEHLSGREEHSFTLILQSQFREAPILPQNVEAFSLNHREVVCRKLTSMASGPSPAPWKKLSVTNSFFWVALSTAIGPHGLFKN